MEVSRFIDVGLCKELFGAAKQGNSKRVKELLQRGADAHFGQRHQWETKTALVVACERGHVGVVRVILEHGGETQDELEKALCEAAGGGHMDVLRLLLLERRVDPSAFDNRAVRFASGEGRCEVVKLLLSDPRVDPGAEESEAFRWAAENGNCQVLELLLRDSRVDPAACSNEAICVAVDGGHWGAAMILLADPRVDGTRAICAARCDLARILIQNQRCGIHVNRDVFEQHHRREVERFDELIQERTARIVSMWWVMKQIGGGWGDLGKLVEERMQSIPLDWGVK